MSPRGGRVSAVIVNWNVLPLLRACLASLPAAGVPLSDTVVVDNASADGSDQAVRLEFPEATLLPSGGNLGFPAGVNRGLAAGPGDYVLILNPDTELAPGAIPALVARLDAEPQVGLVAPRLLSADGTPQATRRRFPSLAVLALESTPLARLPVARRVVDRYRCTDSSDAHVQEIDWPYGAAYLVRRDALEEAGGMDAGYFMYSEEVDLCRRLTQLGWRVLYEPAASVLHHEGKKQRTGADGNGGSLQSGEGALRRQAPWSNGRRGPAPVAAWGALVAVGGRSRETGPGTQAGDAQGTVSPLPSCDRHRIA